MSTNSTCLAGCYGSVSTAPPGGPSFDAACLERCFLEAGWSPPSQPSGADSLKLLPLWALIIISIVLMCFSATFSGLNISLLSLDLVSLRILEKAGEPLERKWASALIPVRAKGNLLLCSILLGGTVVNSGVSILLTSVTGSGLMALLVSTLLIMIFGEILPQAVFCRHSLMVGYKTIWLTRFFMILFFPICYPIAFMLDCLLDRDIGTVYSSAELKHLIELHVEDPDAQKESGLTLADRRMLTGVFEYKDKKVRDVMTKLEECFCLEQAMRLNFQTLSAIYLSGCSRIPVYHGDRQNIVGILFVKDLILVDPDDELELSTVMAFRARTVMRVYEDVTLDKVLAKFLSGRSHMLIAHAPPVAANDAALDGPTISHTPVTGLITLEDVMEELISMEIYDETDPAAEPVKGDRRSNKQHQQAMFMSLFEHKMRGAKLSPQEVQAVCSFLALNIEEFRSVASSDLAFRGLIRAAEVLEKSSEEAPAMPHLSTSVAPYGSPLWLDTVAQGGLLYERGKVTPYFTLILQGKVMVHTGDEGFDLDLGPWSHMGNKALHYEQYTPNFDAVAVPPYRIVRIHRRAFAAALDAMRLEHARGFQSIRQHINSQGQLLGGPEREAAGGAAGAAAAGGPASGGSGGHLVGLWDGWAGSSTAGTDPGAGGPDSVRLDLPAAPQPRSSSFSGLPEGPSPPVVPPTRAALLQQLPSFRRHQGPFPLGALGGEGGGPSWPPVPEQQRLPPRPSSAGGIPGSASLGFLPGPMPFWPRPTSPPPTFGVSGVESPPPGLLSPPPPPMVGPADSQRDSCDGPSSRSLNDLHSIDSSSDPGSPRTADNV